MQNYAEENVKDGKGVQVYIFLVKGFSSNEPVAEWISRAAILTHQVPAWKNDGYCCPIFYIHDHLVKLVPH